MAVLVTVSKANALMVILVMFGKVGAKFTSRTITVKVLVAVKCGLTRSKESVLVTTVVMRLVLGLLVWAGVQAMMPFVLMVIPAGGLSSP